MACNVKTLFILMRPHQYIKNLFIFMPLFFAGQIANTELLINAMIAFVAFSISASAIYIVNDYFDRKEDREHPQKKYRPIASGAISDKSAAVLMCVLFVVGGTLMATLLSLQVFGVLCVYVVLNISYSLYLKHIAIVDVTIVAIGFVLRLFVGSLVTETPLSKWIVIMTFLLAMFMALAKRRDDVLLFASTGEKMRKVIDGYSLQFIDGAMMIMASVVIVSYILYTTSVVVQRMHSEYLYLTALFVILGILRYLQIAFVELNSGSPTKIIMTDRFLQVSILAWLISFAWIIYL